MYEIDYELMGRMERHGMFPSYDLEDETRADFVRALRYVMGIDIRGGCDHIWEKEVLPEFVKEHGREPNHPKEVRKAMKSNPYYQFYAAFARTAQELKWDTIIDSAERELPELIERAKPKDTDLGTVKTTPGFEVPRYHTVADIHCQPGAYHTDVVEDDVAAGYINDFGLNLYQIGQVGWRNENIGKANVNYFLEKYPGFKPKKILDVGCGPGTSTGAWCEAFPDAEVYAVDAGAPCLRYAHGRSEALGHKVHYSQQNIEHMDFEDDSFDLVVSHFVLHETSYKALPKIIQDCYRVLKPGGVMSHFDIPSNNELMSLYDLFMVQYEVENHNEAFFGIMCDMDLPKIATDAGFENGRTDKVPFGTEGIYGDEPVVYTVTAGEKPMAQARAVND